MMHPLRGLGLATTLALVSGLCAVPPAEAQSPSAYVYIQTGGPAGPVYGYSASAAGQLTPIPGSPFKPGTAIVGGNGSKFFTLGHTLLHSWAVGSNGAIQSQLSQIPLFDYAGSSCGAAQGGQDNAVLDHTGKYMYVVLQVPGGNCAGYQSYILNNDGSFSFDGDTELNLNNGSGTNAGIPSILGNESFAYSQYDYLDSGPTMTGFQRQSSGTLQLMQFQQNYPALNGDYYVAGNPDASPAGNYVMVELSPAGGGATQLASYTVDSQGNLTTSNTSSNMPASAFIWPSTKFSPSGTMLAAYADGAESNGKSGIELYRFNGSAPLTLYENLLSGTPIDDLQWDTSNHMYAISKANNMVYVFAVTTNSANLVASMPLSTPVSIVAVSQTASNGSSGCPAPEGQGINVCTPQTGSTVGSPVQINAAANVSGGVYRFELWNGSTKLLTVRNSNVMDQTISLAPGSYRLTFVAYNSAGNHVYYKSAFTVQ